MNRVPDRKSLRREYLRKKVTGYLMASLSVVLPVIAVVAMLMLHVYEEQHVISPIAAISIVVCALMVGLFALKMSGHAEIVSRTPYVPPVTVSTLPIEEVLVRGAEEPSASSETLLRATVNNEETKAEELLRVAPITIALWAILLCPLVAPTPVIAQTTEAKYIAIVGQVSHPNEWMRLHPALTLRDYLSLVGGTTSIANRKAVRIRRRSREILVDLDKAEQGDPQNNLTLQPGDYVQVESLPPSELFYVGGSVKQAGTYRYKPGMTLIQAIIGVGGLSLDTEVGNGAIVRHPIGHPDQTKTLRFKWHALLKDTKKDLDILPGDIVWTWPDSRSFAYYLGSLPVANWHCFTPH